VLRKKLAVMLAAALMAMMALAGPASAQSAHPFCGSGQEYAQEHVVALGTTDNGA
jgi:type II secretory pathway component PulK